MEVKRQMTTQQSPYREEEKQNQVLNKIRNAELQFDSCCFAESRILSTLVTITWHRIRFKYFIRRHSASTTQAPFLSDYLHRYSFKFENGVPDFPIEDILKQWTHHINNSSHRGKEIAQEEEIFHLVNSFPQDIRGLHRLSLHYIDNIYARINFNSIRQALTSTFFWERMSSLQILSLFVLESYCRPLGPHDQEQLEISLEPLQQLRELKARLNFNSDKIERNVTIKDFPSSLESLSIIGRNVYYAKEELVYHQNLKSFTLDVQDNYEILDQFLPTYLQELIIPKIPKSLLSRLNNLYFLEMYQPLEEIKNLQNLRELRLPYFRKDSSVLLSNLPSLKILTVNNQILILRVKIKEQAIIIGEIGSHEKDKWRRLNENQLSLKLGQMMDTTNHYLEGINIAIGSKQHLSLLQNKASKNQFQLVKLKKSFPEINVSLPSVRALQIQGKEEILKENPIKLSFSCKLLRVVMLDLPGSKLSLLFSVKLEYLRVKCQELAIGGDGQLEMLYIKEVKSIRALSKFKILASLKQFILFQYPDQLQPILIQDEIKLESLESLTMEGFVNSSLQSILKHCIGQVEVTLSGEVLTGEKESCLNIDCEKIKALDIGDLEAKDVKVLLGEFHELIIVGETEIRRVTTVLKK